ncbi:hypothetical protein EC957_010965 [Mortierella hygrophila]|uniref:Zinc finger Mcm10/DnaG-type domain-containing protein n=1 Tax=Mortierella hygrophila TaxID=979708 RepID=A0A9P6K478_9FUNG|nr:hypothetical protein EC957_010965 [Mortierella hygrophila]
MDSDGSAKDVPGQSKDNDDVAQRNQQEQGNSDNQSGTKLTSSIPSNSNNKQEPSPIKFTPAMTHHEIKRQRSASPAGPTTYTSDDEDLALLEEVSRIKAQLEAKLRAKKKAKIEKVEGDQSCGSNTPSKGVQATTTTGAQTPSNGAKTPRTKQNSSHVPPPPAPADEDEDPFLLTTSNTTTPPTTRTPLSSPGFKTPSPPARTKLLMSPSSGASARKRQHSPSPMTRRSPRGLTMSPRGSLSSTPLGSSGQSRFLQRLDDTVETDVSLDTKEGTAEADAPQEVEQEDDFDDAMLESALDEDDFDDDFSSKQESISKPDLTLSPRLKSMIKPDFGLSSNKMRVNQPDFTSSTASTSGGPTGRTKQSADMASLRSTTSSLTEAVIAKQQERLAVQAAQYGPTATFRTVGNDSLPASTREATRLGHAAGLDPLSGVRLRSRITSCEDAARMTRDICNIPIKDHDSIRARTEQRTKAGLLPSFSGAGLLRPKNDTKQGSGPSESTLGHWMVAGVVGAKSKPKMTAKKVQYCHFQLSDLHSAMINVFLFRDVMERHYEGLRIGDVVAIMNPKVLSQAERAGTLGVEVEHPDCLLVLGTSTDFGLCEAVKLNGDNCNRPLDKRASSYCSYHIMMVANKGRNQRGSLIAGTSSILDLDKSASRPFKPPGPHKAGGGLGRSSSSSFLQSGSKGPPQETTYLFDDGGVGTSLMADPKKAKKVVNQLDDELSAFLMTQNNPGGHYLRQAKESKDVTWAKDVPSPKTPTKNSEMFPAEMVRRMGYDPVTGQFVPGSPKRMNEDPEARERSLRLLAERVRSPPSSPLSSFSPTGHRHTMVVKGMTRVIAQPKSKAAHAPGKTSTAGKEVAGDVFFRNRGAAAVGTPGGSGSPLTSPKKWVDLDVSSESDPELDDDGNPVLSLSQQRNKNLLEAKGENGKRAVPGSRSVAPSSSGSASTSMSPSLSRLSFKPHQSGAPGRAQVPASSSSASKTMLLQRTEAKTVKPTTSAAVPSDTQPPRGTPNTSTTNTRSSSSRSLNRSGGGGGSSSSSGGSKSGGNGKAAAKYVDLSD